MARLNEDLRIAIIGQSVFGQQVYRLLRNQGRNIVGVFTIPDQNGRMDPLAAQAHSDGVPLFKFRRWREKGLDGICNLMAHTSSNIWHL